MTKTLIIMRDGYDASYLFHMLSQVENEYSFIIEKGDKARKKKFKNMIKKRGIMTFFDSLTLLIYDSYMILKMKKILGNFNAVDKSIMRVSDINDNQVIKEIEKRTPKLLLIYGTAILKKETIQNIQKLGIEIFNIHSSILPSYRNVHSDFWAYVNKEYNKIGITVFKLDVGIDTGKIAMQKYADEENIGNKELYEYKAINLQLVVKAIIDFVKQYKSGVVELYSQSEEEVSIGITPRMKDILLFCKEKFINRE